MYLKPWLTLNRCRHLPSVFVSTSFVELMFPAKTVVAAHLLNFFRYDTQPHGGPVICDDCGGTQCCGDDTAAMCRCATPANQVHY